MAERIESDMDVSFEVMSPLVEILIQKSQHRQEYMENKTDMVDILQEGLKLKLDLQNLKKEFNDILEARSCHQKSEPVTEERVTFNPDTARKQRKDMVLVSSDFNAGRIQSDPTGLVVRDRPSSQAAMTTPTRRSHARSVYKNHKRRLMARRESGDGAVLEAKTGAISTPLNSRTVSPMRRVPIKEKLTELGSPFGLMPKQDCPKLMALSPFQGDYKLVVRPSPEGLLAPHTRHNSCTATNNIKPAMKKRCKKQFPKTPKSAKMASHQLQTIGENEQISVQKGKRSLFSENLIFQNKQSCATDYDTDSDVFTKTIKDITNISHISGKNLREQPSSTNFRDQFQNTFDYQLHSTMNYPLHSTMQNAHKDLDLSDSESDLSSIVDKPASQNYNQKSQKVLGHTKSPSGISLADSGTPSSPRSQDIPKQHYVNLSKAKGVNMDTFSFDEGIHVLSNDDSEESICKPRDNIPVTPVSVVKDYYTLTYTPEELKREAAESECNSSYLSFNVDNPTTEDHHDDGHFKMPNMVSCRCHVNQVYKIKRQTGFLEHSERNAHLIESTLSMDTRVRAIYPAELEMLARRTNTTSKASSSSSSAKYRKPANRINADSILNSDSDINRKCEKVSSTKPAELREPKVHSTSCGRNTERVVVKPMSGAETNCLNLGKILKVKDGKKDFVENTIINHTLANPNVTMVTQGCLGFLKRKNKSSKKKTGTTKVKSEGKRKSQVEDNYEENEDKENFRSRYQTAHCRVKSQGVSCDIVDKSSRSSEVSHSSSMLSNMDHELKRKLSKRMKEFRDTTFTDPHRMYYQTMGHI